MFFNNSEKENAAVSGFQVQKAVALIWEDCNGVLSALRKKENKNSVGGLSRKLRGGNIEEDLEKRVLRETIDGLNQTLVEQRIKVAELEKANGKYKREKMRMKNKLEFQTAEVNYLTKIAVPRAVLGEPLVVWKIARLEKRNRELAAKYEELLLDVENNLAKGDENIPATNTSTMQESLDTSDCKNLIPESIELTILPVSGNDRRSKSHLNTVSVQTDISFYNWFDMSKEFLRIFSRHKKSKLSSNRSVLVDILPEYRDDLERKENFHSKIGAVGFLKNPTTLSLISFHTLRFSMSNIILCCKLIRALRMTSFFDFERANNLADIDRKGDGAGGGGVKSTKLIDIGNQTMETSQRKYFEGLDIEVLSKAKNYDIGGMTCDRCIQPLMKNDGSINGYR